LIDYVSVRVVLDESKNIFVTPEVLGIWKLDVPARLEIWLPMQANSPSDDRWSQGGVSLLDWVAAYANEHAKPPA
jgi:hypothetical protein